MVTTMTRKTTTTAPMTPHRMLTRGLAGSVLTQDISQIHSETLN